MSKELQKAEKQMTRYAEMISAGALDTPQTEKAHAKQQKNNAGGYSFKIDKWGRLQRFLILGAEGGTYYVGRNQHMRQNYAALQECLAQDGVRTVNEIVSISQAGRAPKNDPAIFSLAVASAHPEAQVRRAALEAMPQVCRIGTHLFDFLSSLKEFRGFGRGVRQAVAAWYLEKSSEQLGFQVTKYRQRNGWSHQDVLRKLGGEMGKADPRQAMVLRWVVQGMGGFGARTVDRDGAKTQYAQLTSPQHTLPEIIWGFEYCQYARTDKEAAEYVREYRLTHEMVPSQFLKSKKVWEALLENMPIGALVRNLGRMTSLGCFEPFSDAQKKAVALLENPVAVKKARLHPMAALKALKQYSAGRGLRGNLAWQPDPRIRSALEGAFYLGFDAVEPTGLNTLISLDVSGSMSWGCVDGMDNINCAEAAAAMSMVAVRTEKNYEVRAFCDRLMSLDITPKDDLDSVLNKTRGLNFGRTDCSLPMVWAKKARIPVDCFYVYTDNETYAGSVHPHVALEQYRQTMGRDAKLVVVGMQSNEFSIANPDDPGMLDVVGFDTAAPAVMSEFCRQGFA